MTMQSPHGSVERRTLGEQVYEILKVRLIDRELAPGSKVTIDKIGRELGVSPTPVREALAALEVEGLVTKEPLVGYTVAPPLDRAAFEQLWEARLIVEPSAARLAAARADADDRAAIDRAAQAALQVEGSDHVHPPLRLAQVDAEFHRLILRTAGNPVLADWFDRLHVHVHLYRLRFDPGSESAALVEHGAVAVAIGAGEPDQAEQAMVDHLALARDRLVPVFDGT